MFTDLLKVTAHEAGPCWGPEEGRSWHGTINDGASLTDAIDAAQVSNLFTVGDLFAFADSLKKVEVSVKKSCSVFGVDIDKRRLGRSAEVRGKLALTKAEALLVRAFMPDAMDAITPRDREAHCRAVKVQCVRHAKWNSLFKPVYLRALDALAGK